MLLIIAFFTFIIEFFVFFIKYRKKIETSYLIKTTFLVNFITNLILNSSVMYVGSYARGTFNRLVTYVYGVVIGEILVVFVEYFMYKYAYKNYIDKKEITKIGLFVMSFLSNLISFGIGLFIISFG